MLLYDVRPRCLFASDDTLLSNTCLLTGELTQVVQLGTTHFTNLVHFDVVNVRAFQGEDTLHTYVARHLAHRETLFVLMATNLDDHAAILLNALFVTFDDFVCYGHRVARLEFGVFLTGSKCFLCNFN